MPVMWFCGASVCSVNHGDQATRRSMSTSLLVSAALVVCGLWALSAYLVVMWFLHAVAASAPGQDHQFFGHRHYEGPYGYLALGTAAVSALVTVVGVAVFARRLRHPK